MNFFDWFSLIKRNTQDCLISWGLLKPKNKTCDKAEIIFKRDTGKVDKKQYGKKRMIKRENMTPQNNEQAQMFSAVQNQMQSQSQQPIIVLNIEPQVLADIMKQNTKYKDDKNYRLQKHGHNNKNLSLFLLFRNIKSIIKLLLLITIIVIVIILVKNPNIINNLFINIMKKIGLYDIIKSLRGLF